MRKHDELRHGASCLNRAGDHEMLFVLLSRDPAAPVAIRAWIAQRISLGLNVRSDMQIQHAEECARIMEEEKKQYK